MLTPAIVGDRHYRVARAVRTVLAEYEELKDIIAMLGMEELSEKDRATVQKARQLERFLTQPFFATEQFTELTPTAGVGLSPANTGGGLVHMGVAGMVRVHVAVREAFVRVPVRVGPVAPGPAQSPGHVDQAE